MVYISCYICICYAFQSWGCCPVPPTSTVSRFELWLHHSVLFTPRWYFAASWSSWCHHGFHVVFQFVGDMRKQAHWRGFHAGHKRLDENAASLDYQALLVVDFYKAKCLWVSLEPHIPNIFSVLIDQDLWQAHGDNQRGRHMSQHSKNKMDCYSLLIMQLPAVQSDSTVLYNASFPWIPFSSQVIHPPRHYPRIPLILLLASCDCSTLLVSRRLANQHLST